MSIAAVLANEIRWHVEVCDVRDGLRRLPDQSIHVICTSPPYWGLRNYEIPPSIWGGDASCRHKWCEQTIIDTKHAGRGSLDEKRKSRTVRKVVSHWATCRRCSAWRGCFGDEPTIELYIEHTIEILRECRRVLRDDGQLWWNVGDSFGSDSKWGGHTSGLHVDELHGQGAANRNKRTSGQPDLSKLMIPHRVALAAQADGWIVRQDNVWSKASPMPESVQSVWYIACRWPAGRDEKGKIQWRPCDGRGPGGKPCHRCFAWQGRRIRLQQGAWRCTTAHEFVFQLVKGQDYFSDAEGVKESAVGTRPGNRVAGKLAEVTGDGGKTARFAVNMRGMDAVTHKNPRSVWHISHEPMREKHFAPFPSFIPHRAIAASTSSHGVCASCGANFAPIVEKLRVATRPGVKSKIYDSYPLDPDSPYQTHRGDVCGNKDPKRHTTTRKVLGWLPTCQCPPADPLPAIVLDIFSGSGTTGRKAFWLGRRYIGLEINPAYAELSLARIEKPYKKRLVPKHKRPLDGQKALFD